MHSLVNNKLWYFHFPQYSTYDSEKGQVSCSTDCSVFPPPLQTDIFLNYLSILGRGKSVLERQQGLRVAMEPPMFCLSRETSTWWVLRAHEHCHGRETRCFLLKFHTFISYYFLLEVITQSGRLSHSVFDLQQEYNVHSLHIQVHSLHIQSGPVANFTFHREDCCFISISFL